MFFLEAITTVLINTEQLKPHKLLRLLPVHEDVRFMMQCFKVKHKKAGNAREYSADDLDRM